ncbi:helix-turn-helix domain-containing protein [Streptomyces sp. DSM 44917]|uniref:Helix-turn-helix domain-containing protein n=1 Tax=Streptomyces boetiae TaxID=3075541 RepID=A0ABU2L4I4_9ACTN|nr:helix-turn-helix domain-containing protein [Streptomyces sp. DSM 44917]MDT0306471.1 helix-turn-helix domain-containing protein [Streptomyces sp. DSM 44917]
MIRTVFHSEDLPPQERLAAFNAAQVRNPHPVRFGSERPQEFWATARELDLGTVNVSVLTCSTAEVRRTPRLIRDWDPELCSLVLPLRGDVAIGQAGRQAVLEEGDFAVYESSKPFRALVGGGSGTATVVTAHVPRRLLSHPAGDDGRLLAVRLPGRDGVGALLTQFLTGLMAGAPTYRPNDVPRLSTVAIDLLTMALAHYADHGRSVPPDAQQRVLLVRIQAFVQRRLHDPLLTPAAIAAAHHISLGHLHRLFRAQDTTVSAWIRRRRLERARRDLADPLLCALPVHRIAARCGFKDHATFTRSFRAAFGVPPKEYRRNALSPAA